MHYMDSEVDAMNATARENGAVGANPIVLRYVRTLVGQGDMVLDYGSGKTRRHATALAADTGAVVDAFEIGANRTPQHVPTVVGQTYDVAYASNVLNVQPTAYAATCVLTDLRDAIHAAGVVVFNYPEPCKHYRMDKATLLRAAQAIFGYVAESDEMPGVFIAMRP